MKTYVIVNEGSYFPGLVIRVKKTTYEVSCMIKSGPDTWKWPDKKDVCEYDPTEIEEIIKAPQMINSRGQYIVPEADKFWKG